MKQLFILLSPVLWSIKNNIIRFDKSFYKNALFYFLSSSVFLFFITKLLNTGMVKLQNLSPEVFHVLLIKGYSFIFIIIFFIQIINGFVLSLNTYYQSKDLEVLLSSPVNRMSLFFSRFLETHLRASWMLIIFGIPLLVSSGLIFDAHLSYYFYSLTIFTAFSTIPVNIGTGITMVITNVFHLKKLKKFLFSAGFIALILVITLLRIVKPERFVNPELFANLTLFLSEIKTPTFILLPNRWLSESLFNFLNENYSDIFIYVSLLFLTSYITTFLLQIIFKSCHYKGWMLLQEGGFIRKERGRPVSRIFNFIKKVIDKNPVQQLLSVVDIQSRQLIRKDHVYQIREIKNINQILILLSLIIVYLFSIASLPLNWEYFAIKLKYVISFFNLALILIIITSISSRLIYQALVSEANSLWIIKTSPMTPKRYIWTKFFFFFIPIFFFGQLLTVFSSFFIDIERGVFMVKMITTTLVSFSLVSMAVAFSISDLKNSMNDSAREQTKTGSTLYMIISVFFIVFILGLEIIPLFLFFLKESPTIVFTHKAWIIIGGVILILLFVNILVTVVSMHMSIKRIDSLQLS